MAHGQLKKLLRFVACNPHHGTLGLGLRLGEGTPYSAWITRRTFKSNNLRHENYAASGGSRGGRLGQLPRAPREGGTKEGEQK